MYHHQTFFDEQGFYAVTIDGKLIHNIPLLNPVTFQDVKVFAGDKKNPPADASYKNLLLKKMPVPDIMLNIHTPTIVSREN